MHTLHTWSALEYFMNVDDSLLEVSYHDYDTFEYEQNDSPPVSKGRLKAHLP